MLGQSASSSAYGAREEYAEEVMSEPVKVYYYPDLKATPVKVECTEAVLSKGAVKTKKGKKDTRCKTQRAKQEDIIKNTKTKDETQTARTYTHELKLQVDTRKQKKQKIRKESKGEGETNKEHK